MARRLGSRCGPSRFEDDPEAIKVDERKAPRTKPQLARSREVIKTPFECWYNSAVSHEMLDKAERYINQRLDGKKRETRKTSRGEIVRYLCTMGTIALRPGTSLKKMWQQVRGPKDIFPPPGLGSVRPHQESLRGAQCLSKLVLST